MQTILEKIASLVAVCGTRGFQICHTPMNGRSEWTVRVDGGLGARWKSIATSESLSEVLDKAMEAFDRDREPTGYLKSER